MTPSAARKHPVGALVQVRVNGIWRDGVVSGIDTRKHQSARTTAKVLVSVEGIDGDVGAAFQDMLRARKAAK